MAFQTLGEWERDRFSAQVADEIDGLPETDEPAHAPAEFDPTVLMERTYAGLLVELRYLNDEITILVREGERGKPMTAVVPSEKALDAFHHPYCYLPV